MLATLLRRREFVAAVLAVTILLPVTSHAQDAEAQRLLDSALKAMGGREALESVRLLKISGIEQRNLLEQSTRPEGPWFPEYRQFEETRDFEQGRRHVKQSVRGLAYGDEHLNSDGWMESELTVDERAATMMWGGRSGPGPASAIAETDEALTLDPLRILLHAGAAPDLHTEADVQLHGVRHRVLAWRWNDHPVRIFVNAGSGLPDEIEWTRHYPYSFFLGIWGDVDTRVSFDGWMIEEGGLRYPRLWSIERNGQPDRQVSITRLAINPADASVPAISDTDRAAFAARRHTISELPLGMPDRPAVNAAAGIVALPGYWNVGFVQQDDGVVILDAPISSAYSAKVLAEAASRFPGQPVKALVTTSDAWPHIGGLREYVARGIPVYALDLNRGILERLVNASHVSEPDALEQQPRKPQWHWIEERTALGRGNNRMELIPVRGQAGERQMFVYFPAHKLLYTSDIMQPLPGTDDWFTAAFVAEAKAVVEREQLDVTQGFGLHYLPTDWRKPMEWLKGSEGK